MDPTSGIRKHGFRKWYERQLIECHAALVTCLLCGVTLAALIEVVSLRDFGWRTASIVATMFAAGVLGWYSWRQHAGVRVLRAPPCEPFMHRHTMNGPDNRCG